MGLSGSHEDGSNETTTPEAELPLAITEELNRREITLGWECGSPVVVVSVEECVNRFKEWKGDRKIEWDCSDLIIVNEMGEVVDLEDVPTLKVMNMTDTTNAVIAVALAASTACCHVSVVTGHLNAAALNNNKSSAITAAVTSTLCISILHNDHDDDKDKLPFSISRTSSTLSSVETTNTDATDDSTGMLPPTISCIDPPFGTIGSSVLIHGSLFGGCSISDLRVLCGLHSSSELSGKPVVATDVERLSSKLLRVRIPEGVRSSFPIIVTSPFGRSAKNNLHFKVITPSEETPRLCITSAQLLDGELHLEGRNFSLPLTITVAGCTLPEDSITLVSEFELSASLPSFPDNTTASGTPIVMYNDVTSCSYIHNAKKNASNMRGRSGSYIPVALRNENKNALKYWAIAPNTVAWHGISMQTIIRVMHKLKALEQYRVHTNDESKISTFRQPIPEAYLLTLQDFQALCKSQELREQYFFYKTQPGSVATAPLFRSICQALWSQAEDFKLMDIAVQGYRDGDVLFYDLQNRAALGDIDLKDRWSSAFFRLQKGYDRYSHSGIFVRRSGKASRPAIFHGLRTRVKDLIVPAAFSYMPKREVDLGKVFFRFQFLSEEMRAKMYLWYQEGMCARSRQGQLILNDCADLWDIVTVVNSVPTERRKSLTQVGEQQHQRRGSVAKIMCSAFTASVLLETFLEVQDRLHAIADQETDSALSSFYKSVHVHPSLLVDTLAVAPKLLHQWNIWRDQLQEEPGLLQIAASDVRSSFEQLQSLQVKEVS